MMNFMLSTYGYLLRGIDSAQGFANAHSPNTRIRDDEAKELGENMQQLLQTASRLEMHGAQARLKRILELLKNSPSWADLAAQMQVLREAFEDDSYDAYVYVYPPSKVAPLVKSGDEWGVVFKAFPSVSAEVESGLDCYALGHNTACIFHMCRVTEVGLRAIGSERGVATVRRGVPIEWATWGQVFQAIEPAIVDIRKNRPNGPRKDEALAFYDTVLSDLRAIQSLFRDQTMHLRERYDEGEAQGAIFRARELMTKLANKINESSTAPIEWGF